jgi:hypothetical protein
MSYENNNNGGGCLGLAIILGILLTIIYYAIQLAFIVMAGCALVASAAGIYVGLKNFYKVIKAGYQETKTRDYLDKEVLPNLHCRKFPKLPLCPAML